MPDTLARASERFLSAARARRELRGSPLLGTFC